MPENDPSRLSEPPPSGLPASPPVAGSTIVVADDDRITRELLAGMLRANGFNVEALNDGQAVLERVGRGGVDLVLLDILMPRLSGLEACRLLKGMTHETFLPVVLVTVKTDTASRVEGLRIGADDYVCKPFDEQELIARVEAMLRIKRLHDHVSHARSKLEQLSVHDELTGLFNFRYLHTRLSEEFKRAERYHDPLACLVIDIDRLQAVNDAEGRAAGDSVLCGVADVLRRTVRDVDVLARFGGDEFLVVLPSTHFAGSVTVAERIWREVGQRSFFGDASHPFRVTLALGVALYPSRDVRSKDALLRASDAALHQAKSDGGNRVCVFQQHGYLYTPVVGDPAGALPLSERPPATRSSRPPADSARTRIGPPANAARRLGMTLSVAPVPGVLGEAEPAPAPLVLIVDDEPTLRRNLARILLSRGMKVVTAGDGAAAIEVLGKESVDVALVDLMMPKVGGMELLEHVKTHHAEVEVIMMTAFADVETAVRSVRAGAYHFLTKPFRSNDEVVLAVSKAAERRRLLDRARMLERRLEQMERFGELIGNSAAMQEVYRLALGVAPTETTVLILGESGTGKELTARAIHQHSRRLGMPFVAVNCSAIPVNLVESELFGHMRGAFSGAVQTREGLFEAADRGTIFLDEIGDLPPLAQVKLLRVLQEGEIKRVGANETRAIDVRVIAATNVDLKARAASGAFREDLYYRLNVVAIELPALRERRDDIPLLAYHFLHKHAERAGREIKRIDADAMDALQHHHWPGNVRELENALEHAVVFCHGEALGLANLPLSKSTPPRGESNAGRGGWPASVFDLPFSEAKQRALDAFEAAYMSAVLGRAAGNVSEAARQSGLDRSNFRRAAKRVGALPSKR